MKSSITIILITFFSFTFSFAQKVENSKREPVKFVYTKSTPSGKDELSYLLKDDKIGLKSAKQKYFDCERKGKIILSTREYIPIKQRIERTEAKGTNASLEEKKFAELVKENYVLVTDLIDKK